MGLQQLAMKHLAAGETEDARLGEEGAAFFRALAEKKLSGPRACRRCGCTDDRACPGGCAWMPHLKDVCSACATPAEFAQIEARRTRTERP
jgi:hypothetical protein